MSCVPSLPSPSASRAGSLFYASLNVSSTVFVVHLFHCLAMAFYIFFFLPPIRILPCVAPSSAAAAAAYPLDDFFAYITQLTQCCRCHCRRFCSNSSIHSLPCLMLSASWVSGSLCALSITGNSRRRQRWRQQRRRLSPVLIHIHIHPKRRFGLISRLFGFPLYYLCPRPTAHLFHRALSRLWLWPSQVWVSLSELVACVPVPVCVCLRSVSCILARKCARSLFVWAPRCKVVKSPTARRIEYGATERAAADKSREWDCDWRNTSVV